MAHKHSTSNRSGKTVLETFKALSSDDEDFLIVDCGTKTNNLTKIITIEDEVSSDSERDELCSNINSTDNNISNSKIHDEDVHSLSLLLGNVLSHKKVAKKKKKRYYHKKEKIEEEESLVSLLDSQENIANISNDSSTSSSTTSSCTSSGTNSSDVHELSSLLDSVISKKKFKKKSKNHMQTIIESFVVEDSRNQEFSADRKTSDNNSKDKKINEGEDLSILSRTLDKIMKKKKNKDLSNISFTQQENLMIAQSDMHKTIMEGESVPCFQNVKDSTKHIHIESVSDSFGFGNKLTDAKYSEDVVCHDSEQKSEKTLNNFVMDSDTDSSYTSNELVKACDISLQISVQSNNLSLSSEYSSDCKKSIQSASLQVSMKSGSCSLDYCSDESAVYSERSHEIDIQPNKEHMKKEFNLSTSTDNESVLSNELEVSEAKSCSPLENSCLYTTALEGFPHKEFGDCHIPSAKNYNSRGISNTTFPRQMQKVTSDSESSEDNFDSFLVKVRKQNNPVKTRKPANDSMRNFIVSDDESDLDSPEDSAFYVTAQGGILSRLQNSASHEIIVSDEGSDLDSPEDHSFYLTTSRGKLFGHKNSMTVENLNCGFDLSNDSSDDSCYLEKPVNLKSKNKENSFKDEKMLISSSDVVNRKETINTPDQPPPLQSKTAPARCPLSRIQNTARLASTRHQHTYSFLHSLSSDVPDYCRHHDSLKKIHIAEDVTGNKVDDLYEKPFRYVKFFKKYKEELTNRLYKLYNETVFDKQLPEDLPLVWNARLLKTAGYCAYRKSKHLTNNRSARIELSTKVCDSAERLRDTLIHEVCHAAVWLICGANDGHGPYWKLYAKKANRIHPELPVIMRCHNYEINHKFIYKCTGCQYKIGRHSKSLDTRSKACGLCSSPFELYVNSKKDVLTPVSNLTPRTPNKFALFVKENYGSVKKENKGITHKDVMSQLSKDFAAKNRINYH